MFCAFDYETNSLTYWKPDFKVVSAAFTLIQADGTFKRYFKVGAENVKHALEAILRAGHTLLVYNLSFEYAVSKYALGVEIPMNQVVDVQRLVQLWGNLPEGTEKAGAWGLNVSVERILGVAGYKNVYHDWLRENIPDAKKHPGAHIQHLPPDMLKSYNTDDTDYTAYLFQFLTGKFEQEGFNWRIDHELYKILVPPLADSKARGIRVKRTELATYVQTRQIEVRDSDNHFRSIYASEINMVKEALRVKKQATYKKKVVTELPEFNITSKMHLKMLFVDVLRLSPMFFTPKGHPSFKTAHLKSWGTPGEMLSKRGKVLKVIEHSNKLLKVSEADGKFHPGLRLCGTTTGRLAATSS